MRYRNTTREQMVKEFVQVKNNPHVSEGEPFSYFQRKWMLWMD